MVVATEVLMTLLPYLQAAWGRERETLVIQEKVIESKSLCLVLQRILPDLIQDHEDGTFLKVYKNHSIKGLRVSPNIETVAVTKNSDYNTQVPSNTWKGFPRRMATNKPILQRLTSMFRHR